MLRRLLLLALMVLLLSGAGMAYRAHSQYLQASLVAETFELVKPMQEQVADHLVRMGAMPLDNAELGLDPPGSYYGTRVREVAVGRGGLIRVQLGEHMGDEQLLFTPREVAGGGLIWLCTSDTLAPEVLEKLRPTCLATVPTSDSRLLAKVFNRDHDALRSLIDRGIGSVDNVIQGTTPLLEASARGDALSVGLLLAAGAPVDDDAGDTRRLTPLMVALRGGHEAVAEQLLGSGASLQRADHLGRSVFDQARDLDAQQQQARWVPWLLEHADDDVKRALEPTLAAARSVAPSHEALLRLNIDLNAAANTCYWQRIGTLLNGQFDDYSDSRLNQRPLTGQDRETLRELGSSTNCTAELIAWLLDQPVYREGLEWRYVDILQRCDAEAHAALLKDHPLLLESAEGRPGPGEWVARAGLAGCADMVASLHRRSPAKLALPEDVLVEVITAAPREKLLRVVSNLIDAGADVNARSAEGRTPLLASITAEQPVIARYLLDAGARVDVAGIGGTTPLLAATRKGSAFLVRLLLERGAPPDQVDERGQSALHVAVAQGHEELVQLLLGAGADRTLRDRNGVRPLVLAEALNHGAIASSLRQH